MISDGLLLHLPLNGSLRDLSKYRNHALIAGTATDLSWDAGPRGFGQAHSKISSTSTNYAYAAHRTEYATVVFSLSLWVYLSTWVGGDRILNRAEGGYGFALFNYSNTVALRMWNSNLNYTTVVPTTSWQHLAITVDASNNVLMYLNGRLDRVTTTGYQNSATGDFRLFRADYGGTSATGRICDLRYHNRILTPVEIWMLYNGLAKDKSNV